MTSVLNQENFTYCSFGPILPLMDKCRDSDSVLDRWIILNKKICQFICIKLFGKSRDLSNSGQMGVNVNKYGKSGDIQRVYFR